MIQNLTAAQVKQLVQQGCTADDWSNVKIDPGADISRIKNCNFLGQVFIGRQAGRVQDAHGLEKPCGLCNATIINCVIGDRARIANVGVHIANYTLGNDVCIENVGVMQTNAGATFGNGVKVEVLNEAGGREVAIFDELNSQFAYLMCMHRYRPKMIAKLTEIADGHVRKVSSDTGTVGDGAKICSVSEMIDVRVGAGCVINGAASLVNGTILSADEAPTNIGVGVIAHDFIISESCSVTEQAVLEKTFVGQGCIIGKQFSAKDSLFFANCEGFHGEAQSVFAGPYTVSHHKSTLLIAALLSFYNAGSGTNQSNHMYKLGPVHEGKLLRGTKTGSFSYMMWPCRTGPFSVVLGKHAGTFDVEDYPFSHLEARPDGKANFVPGLHLTTVGVVRDFMKWPKRDKRKGKIRRDMITFDVFSPYTAGKMLKAVAELKSLQESTGKDIEEVSVGGARVKRPILRSSQKYYRLGIELYLLENVMRKLEGLGGDNSDIRGIFACEGDSLYSDKWVDIGGQLMGQGRLEQLQSSIETDEISSAEQFHKMLTQIRERYAADEWIWVKTRYAEYFGVDIDNAKMEHLLEAVDSYQKVKSKFLNLVIADAEKEFADLSRTGFGQDGLPGDEHDDFVNVRGSYEENPFVKEMKKQLSDLNEKVRTLKNRLEAEHSILRT